MKNTLKIVLILIGTGFLVFGIYNLFTHQPGMEDTREQLYAMLGVGALFLIAGLSMGKR